MSFAPGADVLSVSAFTVPEVESLFDVADDMQRIVASSGGCGLLSRRVLASAFFEPSTRTSCSFGAAMARLGGAVLSVDGASSSAAKGESLADTARSLACYADALVLRHPAVGAAAEAAAAVAIPVINAGDGVGEHPTQALLDLFTLRAERGGLAGTHAVLVGDLRNGRTVHSLAKLLARWPAVRFTLVSPGACRAGKKKQGAMASARAERRRRPPAGNLVRARARAPSSLPQPSSRCPPTFRRRCRRRAAPWRRARR